MKIIYFNNKIKEICEDVKKATRYFGGNKDMAISLASRINLLNNAEEIKDIILMPQLRFHKLKNKGKGSNWDGFFAIDVKTIRDKWRIIIQLLDEKEQPFIPCDIDVIAKYVRIIEIREVSNHYE